MVCSSCGSTEHNCASPLCPYVSIYHQCVILDCGKAQQLKMRLKLIKKQEEQAKRKEMETDILDAVTKQLNAMTVDDFAVFKSTGRLSQKVVIEADDETIMTSIPPKKIEPKIGRPRGSKNRVKLELADPVVLAEENHQG